MASSMLCSARQPTQLGDAVDVRVGAHGVAGPRRCLADRHLLAEHAAGRSVTSSRTDTPSPRPTFMITLGSPTRPMTSSNRSDRAHVGLGDVPDVDVVADAGAVGGGVVDAGDGEGVLLAEGRPHELAEDVRRLLGVDAGRQVRVGADRVEVAQDHRAQLGRGGDVLEDLLHHPLGAGVRRRRVEGVVLTHLEALGRGGVQGRGRREQHPVLAEALERVEELQRLGHVVAVVLVGSSTDSGTMMRAAMWMVASRSGCSSTMRASSARSAMSPS